MNTLRILHIATLNSASQNIGVVRQMQCEMDVARDLGFKWDVELWVADWLDDFDFIRMYPETCKSRLARRHYFAKVIQAYVNVYDLIVIRYMPSDPFLMFLTLGSAKIVFVHHSKEGRALRSNYKGAKGVMYALADWVSCQLILRKADGLVGVTSEIVEYEKRRTRLRSLPSIVSPNGIDLGRFSVAADERRGTVKLVFTASTFFAWHGLGGLLRSLADYPDRRSIELHLVGHVEDEDAAFIETAGLAGSVIVHGRLDIGQLKALLAGADVGIASFGLGEAGLTEACTLKVREYLAAGVPVFSGHRDVAFPGTFDFYRIGAPDIASIVNYATEMRRVQRAVVRDAASRYIDKSMLVARMYDWAEYICGSKG